MKALRNDTEYTSRAKIVYTCASLQTGVQTFVQASISSHKYFWNEWDNISGHHNFGWASRGHCSPCVKSSEGLMPIFISPHMKLEVSWGLKCVITFNVFSISFAIRRSCTNNGWDECQFPQGGQLFRSSDWDWWWGNPIPKGGRKMWGRTTARQRSRSVD